MGEPQQYPVLSDQPFEVRHAQAKIRAVTLLFAIAIVLLAGVAGWGGYYLNARRTDERIAALEKNINARRAERDAQQARVGALLEQYRQAMCALIERTPPDPEVDRQRGIYRCGPYRPVAGATPPAVAGPGTPRVTPSPTGRTPAAPSSPPATHGPSPTRSVSPTPTRTRHGGLCIPIIGICL